MKTVNIQMSIETVAQMISDKMKADKSFRVFVCNVLQEQHRINYIVEVMQNGMPKPELEIGGVFQTDDEHYDWNAKEYFKIGDCKLIGFLPEEMYSPYKIEYVYTDKDGKETRYERTVSKDSLKPIEG